MENNDQRYLFQQNKISDSSAKPPVFAKVMRSKEDVFEGASFTICGSVVRVQAGAKMRRAALQDAVLFVSCSFLRMLLLPAIQLQVQCKQALRHDVGERIVFRETN